MPVKASIVPAMSSNEPLTLPAPGLPNPQAKGGKALQKLLSYVRQQQGDRDDLWAFMAFAMPRAHLSKAQLFQDLWVLWALGERRGGYFVEFGAADGRDLSNTWFLEKEMGWTGILAEPNPVFRAVLKENRGCAISTRCVHSVSGRTVDFLAVKTPEYSRMAEINPGDGHEERRRSDGEIVAVETISLNDLLLEHQAPRRIDYLSVDTEGSEYEILSALDFERWRPRAITVEHNFTPMRERLFELLSSKGYRRVWVGLSRFDDWYVLDAAADVADLAKPDAAPAHISLSSASEPSANGHKPPAKATDFPGRFREIVSDPLNLLIDRVPGAGVVEEALVTLHNGVRVPVQGPGAYYGDFSQILVINRGVHEPLEEYVFQEMLRRMPKRPVMLELGAYWGHYSMWLKTARPEARVILVEPELKSLNAGRINFERNGMSGEFIQALVGTGEFEVDRFVREQGLERLDVLHSDIQGFEVQMLDGAAGFLGRHGADYVFISTHGRKLHRQVLERLRAHDYRIEVSSDVATETTSFDGLVFATSPDIAPLLPGFRPLGREEISLSASDDLIHYLKEIVVQRRG